MSQTQEMLTKIHSLIQEICDIKQEKSNNIETNLPEISRNPHKDNPALLDTSDEGDLRGVYLKDNTPTPYCQLYTRFLNVRYPLPRQILSSS